MTCVHCHRARKKGRTTCNVHHIDGSVKEHAKNRRSRPGKGSVGYRAASLSLKPGEWEALYAAQEGICLLCLHKLWNRFSGVERDKRLERLAAVDHDHQIEKELGIRASIRGLICAYPCNRILRREMTADWLARGVVYVKTRPAQAVLEVA